MRLRQCFLHLSLFPVHMCVHHQTHPIHSTGHQSSPQDQGDTQKVVCFTIRGVYLGCSSHLRYLYWNSFASWTFAIASSTNHTWHISS